MDEDEFQRVAALIHGLAENLALAPPIPEEMISTGNDMAKQILETLSKHEFMFCAELKPAFESAVALIEKAGKEQDGPTFTCYVKTAGTCLLILAQSGQGRADEAVSLTIENLSDFLKAAPTEVEAFGEEHYSTIKKSLVWVVDIMSSTLPSENVRKILHEWLVDNRDSYEEKSWPEFASTANALGESIAGITIKVVVH